MEHISSSSSVWREKVEEEFRVQTALSSLIRTKRLRGYQLSAVLRCCSLHEHAIESQRSGLIVVLPTGSGKTLIASAVAVLDLEIERQKNPKTETRKKVLFLVPTCLLVRQQAKAIREVIVPDLELHVAEYQGGMAVPSSSSFQILVSTPSAYLKLCESERHRIEYGFQNFTRIIFDEVHHVIKKHPYRLIARGIQTLMHDKENTPLILGLSASLTYALGSDSIEEAIHALCTELNLPYNEKSIFTVSNKELVADGYQIPHQDLVSSLQDLNMHSDNIDENRLTLEGNSDKWVDFMRAHRTKKLHSLTECFMSSMKRLEKEVKLQDPSFNSPIEAAMVQEKRKMGEWGSYVNQLSINFSTTQPELSLSYKTLEYMYEAFKILINSRQSALELVMYFLEMTGALLHTHLENLFKLWQEQKNEFCRVAHLKEILVNQQCDR